MRVPFPNNTNFYYHRLPSKVLYYLPVTFLILALLSLVGLALAIGRRLPCWPWYFLGLIHITTILAPKTRINGKMQ